MAGNFENLKFCPEKFALGRFLDEKIGRDRFEIEAKPEVPEKIRVGDHGRCLRVATYWTMKISLNFSDIADVIDVSVGQDEQL